MKKYAVTMIVAAMTIWFHAQVAEAFVGAGSGNLIMQTGKIIASGGSVEDRVAAEKDAFLDATTKSLSESQSRMAMASQNEVQLRQQILQDPKKLMYYIAANQFSKMTSGGASDAAGPSMNAGGASSSGGVSGSIPGSGTGTGSGDRLASFVVAPEDTTAAQKFFVKTHIMPAYPIKHDPVYVQVEVFSYQPGGAANYAPQQILIDGAAVPVKFTGYPTQTIWQYRTNWQKIEEAVPWGINQKHTVAVIAKDGNTFLKGRIEFMAEEMNGLRTADQSGKGKEYGNLCDDGDCINAIQANANKLIANNQQGISLPTIVGTVVDIHEQDGRAVIRVRDKNGDEINVIANRNATHAFKVGDEIGVRGKTVNKDGTVSIEAEDIGKPDEITKLSTKNGGTGKNDTQSQWDKAAADMDEQTKSALANLGGGGGGAVGAGGGSGVAPGGGFSGGGSNQDVNERARQFQAAFEECQQAGAIGSSEFKSCIDKKTADLKTSPIDCSKVDPSGGDLYKWCMETNSKRIGQTYADETPGYATAKSIAKGLATIIGTAAGTAALVALMGMSASVIIPTALAAGLITFVLSEIGSPAGDVSACFTSGSAVSMTWAAIKSNPGEFAKEAGMALLMAGIGGPIASSMGRGISVVGSWILGRTESTILTGAGQAIATAGSWLERTFAVSKLKDADIVEKVASQAQYNNELRYGLEALTGETEGQIGRSLKDAITQMRPARLRQKAAEFLENPENVKAYNEAKEIMKYQPKEVVFKPTMETAESFERVQEVAKGIDIATKDASKVFKGFRESLKDCDRATATSVSTVEKLRDLYNGPNPKK